MASRALTHLDARRRPAMVDVGDKPVTHRVARAEARLLLPLAVGRALRASGHRTSKGPVFDTAVIAGVMAAKRTHELIPFCHPLALEKCQLRIEHRRAARDRGALRSLGASPHRRRDGGAHRALRWRR